MRRAGGTTRNNVGYSMIQYNHLNLPHTINGSGGTINNSYDASGRKRTSTTAGVTTTYFGEIEYEGNAMKAIYHADGRIEKLGGGTFEYQYYIKDHLGNIRVLLKSGPTLMQEYHYYPFGMEQGGTWVAPQGLTQRYKYNGKEFFGSGLGWYDYGARWYDPSIGRFTGVDPIIEKFPYLTSFNYASNDPIRNIDLYGLQGVQFNEEVNGKTVTVIEASLHVGVSASGYSQKDVAKIEKYINKAFDSKIDGNKIDFRINVQTFDADKTSVEAKSSELRRTSIVETATPFPQTPDLNKRSITGAAMTQAKLKPDQQGATRVNEIKISESALDIRHSETHEMAHFFMLGSPNQPVTPQEHENAGGIFKYAKKNTSGEIVSPTENVTKDNVKQILANVPKKKQ